MNEQMQVQGCKAPTGYVECYKRCGRFAKAYSEHSAVVTCCHCFGRGDAARIARLEEQYGSDWTPPTAHAPKAPEGVPAGLPKGYAKCRNNCGRWTGNPYGTTNPQCNTCEARGDEDTLRGYNKTYGPDWTPPVPHPERRAVEVGQTWEYDERSPSLSGERRIVQRHKDGTLAVFHEDGGYNHSNLEFLVNHARLVSAPSPASEPAKACNDDCNKPHGHEGWHTFGPGAANWPTKPAEKAKAAIPPKCIGGRHVCSGAVLLRFFSKGASGHLCDGFVLAAEANAAKMTPSTGTPLPRGYALPEPPQLTHSALWLDNAEDGP